MKKAILSISIIALFAFQSCSNISNRETINTHYGIALTTKKSNEPIDYKEIEKVEIGKDFIYFFEKNEPTPWVIYDKDEVLAIRRLRSPK